jgi:long-chain acyl-CoA synthetase
MSMIYLTQFLARAARMYPNRPALRFQDRNCTWAELNAASQSLAGGLRALGIKPGDRVAILALNSDRYVEMLFAAWRVSAAVVPLNTRWSKDELSYALNDSGASILIADDAFAPLVPALSAGSSVKHVIHIGDGAIPEGATAYKSVKSQGTPVAALGQGGDVMAGIFYTGGTTGRPKGVMLAHTGIIATLLAGSVNRAPPPEDASILCVLPMFHMAGAQLAIAAAIAARPLILHPTFDPVAILKCIEADRIDTLSLVPAMWGMMVDHPVARETDLSSLKRVLYGASPMPEGILRRVMKRLPGAEFSQGYGQTETAGICTLLGPEDHDPDGPNAHRLRSAGQPILFSELRIADQSGKDAPVGQVGEICIRSTGNMLGYWNKPEETAATLRDGWIMSGDAGYMDADGYLFIVDRTKDMIISGGENVYSAETESALSSHPDVLECAVIGVLDDKWGERVHGIVRLKPGAQPSPEALIAHCKSPIAGYKCPLSIDFRTDPFPLSPVGKVLKRELRAPYWEGRSRNVN